MQRKVMVKRKPVAYLRIATGIIIIGCYFFPRLRSHLSGFLIKAFNPESLLELVGSSSRISYFVLLLAPFSFVLR